MQDNEFLDPKGDIRLTDKQLIESPELQELAAEVIEKHKI